MQLVPLKMSKEKTDGARLNCSSSANHLLPNDRSSSTESLLSAGGRETSVIATLLIGGMLTVCAYTVHTY